MSRHFQPFNGFDQWLLDASIKTPRNGFSSTARFRVLRAVRRLRLMFSDPLVEFVLGGTKLRLPLSHELPFYRRNLPEYSQNLGRVSSYVKQKYPDLTMIDVGANVGDSAAIVRARSNHPILCIEGEDRFFQLLAENTKNLEGIELEQAFVGAKGDRASGIKVERGNAYLQMNSGHGGTPLATLRDVLQRHPRFRNSKFLKLDAEGFDCRIIACELLLLERCKTVIFFEYQPVGSKLIGQDAFPVFSQLAGIGYALLHIYENAGRFVREIPLDQVNSLKELHDDLVAKQGFCDIVAYHEEDLDIASQVKAVELQSIGEFTV